MAAAARGRLARHRRGARACRGRRLEGRGRRGARRVVGHPRPPPPGRFEREYDRYAPEWRILGLVLDDERTRACAKFPRTLALLESSGALAHAQEVFFAKQPAGTGCAPHSDNRNFILGAHLGLVADGTAWIRVGAAPEHRWLPGEPFVFDGSFVHSTFNPGPADRVVLIVRFWAPELSLIDRRALRDVLWAIQAYGTLGNLEAADAWADKMLRDPPGLDLG